MSINFPWEYNYGKSYNELYDYRAKKSAVGNYISYMLDRTQRIFKYSNLPDTIPQRMLELYMQINGFCVISKRSEKLYAFFGGLGGAADSPYYQPTWCTVSNPALKFSETLIIGKDCELIRNDSMLNGLIPLFSRYATALMENDISFDIASKNLRVASIISAPDSRTKQAAEEFLNDIADGKQGAIAEEPFFDGVKVSPYARTENRTLTELIEYQQYLRASWYNEIGLNANYNMKREALSMTESQMNFDALLPLVDDMLLERQEGLERVNKLFGTKITVELDSSWKLLQNAQESVEESEDSERSENGGEENEQKETE